MVIHSVRRLLWTIVNETMETSNILDQEANAPIDNHLRIDPLLSCFECEFDCETDDQLKEHVNALHKKD